MCVFSHQNPQEFHFEKYCHCFWNLAPHALCVFYRTTSLVFYQGFMFLFIQKPHNAIGCQESEQLGKI